MRFKNGAYDAIGVLVGGNVTGSLTLQATKKSTFIAQLENQGPDPADQVRARFKLAEFGLNGWGNFQGKTAAWADIPEPGTNPAPHKGITVLKSNGGAPTNLTLDWTPLAADVATFASLISDQCLWVQLDSLAQVGVAFAQDSIKRNLYVTTMSERDEPAVVDGGQFGEPRTGDRHELILHVTCTRLPPPKEGPTLLELAYRRAEGRELTVLEDSPITNGQAAYEGETPTATWHTIVHAYLRTKETLAFDDTTRQRRPIPSPRRNGPCRTRYRCRWSCGA